MKLLLTVFPIFVSFLAGAPITRPAEPPGEPGQVFVLQDYRWVPVNVGRAPTAIDCHFEVVNGSPTVHLELLSDQDFFLFSHHREYDTLAMTDSASAGGFQRMIETPGRYRVLIRNDRGAAPTAVSLTVKTEVDPRPETFSSGVPAGRKSAVIAGSLLVFFGTAFWSGRRLLRAYHHR